MLAHINTPLARVGDAGIAAAFSVPPHWVGKPMHSLRYVTIRLNRR